MKSFKLFAGCLVAALAMSCVAVASASATLLPNYGKCVKKAVAGGTGFKDKDCTKETTGRSAKYEWTLGPGAHPGFTWEAKYPFSEEYRRCSNGIEELEAAKIAREKGEIVEAERKEQNAKQDFEAADKEKPGGLTREECEKVIETEETHSPAVLETEPVMVGKVTRPELRVVCETFTATGEVTGTRTDGDLVIKLTGCESRQGQCTSAGAAAGEIVTSSLDGELGFVERPALKRNKIRAAISIEGEADAPFAIFSCGSEAADVYGSAITEIGADKMVADEEIHFSQSQGAQAFERFIGGTEDILHTSLNGGAAQKTGLRLLAHQINEDGELIEVNTVA